MPRQGQEYERFVYEKLRRLFRDSKVTLNDRIMGHDSGLMREIDVSIRTPVDDQELLYIVSCKDRAKRPADIQVLGEFSAVIKDVRAAKGFLVCTAGFAASNYQYARTLGIELLTVEDINSDRWRAEIQIPLIYIRKRMYYILTAEIIANQELVEKNRDRPLTFRFDIDSPITFDNGATVTTIKDYVPTRLNELGSDAQEGVELDLLRPGLRIDVADVWTESRELTINLTIERKYYLKYLTPKQYSQIRDHPRGTTLPIHIAVSGPSQLDDSFVEVSGDELPVVPIINFTIEEWTDLEHARGEDKSKVWQHNGLTSLGT